MKPTQVIELFANIRKTFVSFFSILMFVALGVGIFLGISWSGPALERAADKTLDEGAFHHFQIQFPYGLTDDDLDRLSQIEGVTQVEAARQSFQTYRLNDEKLTVKVQTLGREINVPVGVEGELPTHVGQIALNKASAKEYGIALGDTITFEEDGDPSSVSAEAASGTDASSEPATSGGAHAETDSGNASGMKYLKDSTFTVTALMDSPEYLALESATYGLSNAPSGKVDMLAWAPAETFDATAFQDGYPVVNVRCDSLAGMGTFSGDYKRASSAIESRIAELGDGAATARYDDLHEQVQTVVDDGERELADAKKKIEDGEKELADGRAMLDAKRSEGEAKLAAGYQELLGYEAQKRQAEQKIADGERKLADGAAALREADEAKESVTAGVNNARKYKARLDADLKKGKITEAEYNAALDAYGKKLDDKLEPYADKYGLVIPPLDHTTFDASLAAIELGLAVFEEIPITYEGKTMTIGEARVKLAEAEKALSAGKKELAEKSAQLQAGWAQYYAGQEELNALVAEGEQKLADGEAQLEQAKEIVAEKEPKLEQAKNQLAEMKKFEWTVLPRAYNAGVVEVSTFSAVTTNLSFSMAALFIIVGLLVSYSAVSRIVHEQVTQIGTKKALGLRSREITTSFLAYSGLAVVAGAIIGAVVAVILVEGIINGVLGGMFVFGSYPPYFGIALCLIVSLLELALVLGATWLACRSILKKHAVELLKGAQPPAGKTRFYEKWAIWDRLPLFTQTVVNNCVNDKRRVFSTVVGVAGCTALIVTAITLNNDVLKSYERHYENVYGFNDITFVDSSVDAAADEVEETLQRNGATSAQIVHKTMSINLPDGERATVNVIAPMDDDAFSRVYHVNPTKGDAFDSTAEGVWMSQAYADHYGAKPGDVVTIDAGDGAKHELVVRGFYEFWLTYHEVVMGREFYEAQFGAAEPNAVFSNAGDTAIEDVRSSLKHIEGFDSVKDDKKYQAVNFDTFSSVSSAVVAIYLALSALMAIVVLLNLNVMFIDEKKRELIVLMINGFSVKDAKRYIYNDSIVLTVLGIIVGLVLGCVMGSITVAAIEPSTALFLKDVDPIAVIVGVVGSAVLSVIMSVIALRRIPKFELTDINKF